mmetsp:Transcript_23104/g.91646  ORF Transcript_23104/g.91646 Transcript_23104/m.91646 type:complete len:162 (+) Transcript_23104:176-661(+)
MRVVDPATNAPFTVTVPANAKPGEVIHVAPPVSTAVPTAEATPLPTAAATSLPTAAVVSETPPTAAPQAPAVQPVGQPVAVIVQPFRAFPVQTVCRSCHRTVVTRTSKETGLAVWGSCCVLCLAGCWLGCCLIPFCVEDLKDTTHTCPECGTLLGEHRLIG